MNDDINGGPGSKIMDPKKSIALGAGLGLIFGAALGNAGIGMIIGACAGVVIGRMEKR